MFSFLSTFLCLCVSVVISLSLSLSSSLSLFLSSSHCLSVSLILHMYVSSLRLFLSGSRVSYYPCISNSLFVFSLCLFSSISWSPSLCVSIFFPLPFISLPLAISLSSCGCLSTSLTVFFCLSRYLLLPVHLLVFVCVPISLILPFCLSLCLCLFFSIIVWTEMFSLKVLAKMFKSSLWNFLIQKYYNDEADDNDTCISYFKIRMHNSECCNAKIE